MLVLDLDEQIKYISDVTTLAYEFADKYVRSETRFYDSKGLNVYPQNESDSDSSYFIDETELVKFITKDTGLSEDFCKRFYVATTLYAWEIGIISKESFSQEDIDSIKECIKIPNYEGV